MTYEPEESALDIYAHGAVSMVAICHAVVRLMKQHTYIITRRTCADLVVLVSVLVVALPFFDYAAMNPAVSLGWCRGGCAQLTSQHCFQLKRTVQRGDAKLLVLSAPRRWVG
eukprot:2018510-Pleurochrysis_carterae.AAC.7